jgi:choline dehydrogenase-like flavoprotein
MSDDPTSGVVDPSGRVHGHDNLFIADGSIHVTNGGFNPALTIVSMALRTAEQLAGSV